MRALSGEDLAVCQCGHVVQNDFRIVGKHDLGRATADLLRGDAAAGKTLQMDVVVARVEAVQVKRVPRLTVDDVVDLLAETRADRGRTGSVGEVEVAPAAD